LLMVAWAGMPIIKRAATSSEGRGFLVMMFPLVVGVGVIGTT
jgi:fucose permease